MSKVVVGMSGGVDSSVAAYLLKEQGYDVIGVTMQIWQDEEQAAQEENGGCCGLSAVDDARRVAAALEIPYYVMNFKKEFKENVIDYFVEEYQNGRTPNPCIACNRYVKWESLLQRSLSIGAEYIATGHYARVVQLENGRYTLRRSATLLIIKLLMGNWGHKLGASIIEKLSSYMEQISTIAGMIGVTVISGLAVNFVKISTKLQYVAQVSETEEKIISLQEMLDAMLPNMLAVLYTGLMFYLIKKKKWSTYKLVIFTIIVGILLSVIGILG